MTERVLARWRAMLFACGWQVHRPPAGSCGTMSQLE